MSIYINILLEFLLVVSSVLLLFKYRKQLGLAPLYILLGSVQYVQVFSGTMISLEVFGEYTLYPGSVILFAAVLFAVLLVYIKEGVASARALMLGIIISNFILSAMFEITYQQEASIASNKDLNALSVFFVNYTYLITGTIILFFDFIFLSVIYQFLITKVNKSPLFLLIFLSLFSVLIFDAFVFNISLKYGASDFKVSLISHIISKSIAALIFSISLYLYLKYLDKETNKATFIATQNRDIFSILRYRKKYLDLKVEKEQVEKELTFQLETSLNNISDGFVSLDINWCYTYVNKKAGEFFGRSPESLVGKHIWTEFPDAVGLSLYKAYYRAVETQKTIYFEEYDESLAIWFENRIYPSPSGLTIYYTDITEERNAKLALKESENHIRTILETEPECIKQLNAKGELIYMNPAGLAMIEADNLEMVKGQSVINIIMPDHQKAFEKLNNQIFKGQSGKLEFKIKGLKGAMRWLETHAVPLKDNDGNIISLLSVTRDVTIRKQAETALIESEKHLDNIINNIGAPVFVKDDQRRLMIVNDAFCKMFNLSRADIIGKMMADDVSIEERESILSTDKQVLDTGIENSSEWSFTIKDEKTIIVSTIKTRFIDDTGNKFLIGTIRDITERKKSEFELKLAKEFTDKLIMSMQEGLIIVNLEGEIIMVNDSACNILDYSREEFILLKMPYPFVKLEDLEVIPKAYEKAVQGESLSFKFEFIRKNGEKVLTSVLTGNIKNDKGEVIALFGTIKDISEEEKTKRLLLENAAKSNEKKKIILELAGLVGTDYKTALQKITALSAQVLNVSRASVWKFNDAKNEVECELLFDVKNQNFESGRVFTEIENPNYFEAIFKNKIISIEDGIKNKVTKNFAEKHLSPFGITSMLDVVIQVSNDLHGILCFQHVGPKRLWSVEEEEFATNIANLVSLMVESTARKIAKNDTVRANEQLLIANKELNVLQHKLEQENVYLRNELDLVFNYEEMVYGSEAFSNVLSEVERVAPTTATVLLLGESGTGKELLARAVHNISLRNNKPLIKVNCSAIPRELMESEFFGHKKGSFTGAISDKIGKFELADGGTLFLDEIGDLPIDMQPKILRFLQEGEIEVVGGAQSKKLNVRVIAATNLNLIEKIKKNKFREDLYFRLNVFPIVVPPLRKRKDDIPLLVEHFIDKFNKAYGKSIKYIADDTMRQLKAYDWPGNIRELENLIERASILSNTETLIIPGFESLTQKTNQPINNKDLSLDTAQRKHILQVLEQCDWKISGANGAANILDLNPSTLRDKISKLDLKKPTTN
jgi:PAS domain S-box-containing protein